jgi:hypothetical protein
MRRAIEKQNVIFTRSVYPVVTGLLDMLADPTVYCLSLPWIMRWMSAGKTICT